MAALVLVLLLVALVFGVAFAVKWLLIVGAIVAAVWVIGVLLARSG
jgi:hypothetical protein